MSHDPSRRHFLKVSAAAGGGMLIALHVPGRFAAAAAPDYQFAPNAFVRIGSDGSITVIVNKSEMGQGVYTSLPMVLAEELEADWSRIRVEAAPAHPDYKHTVFGIQVTGGSTSVASTWEQLRKAGAVARELLIAAAARRWKVDPESCRAERGEVIHPPSGRRLAYGKLAQAAAKLTPPEDVILKSPDEFRIIGRSRRRYEGPDKVTGRARFGIDVKLPGMLTAVVARSPVFGGSVKAFDADRAMAVPGVKRVVQVPSGVAVLAEGFWAAKKGRDALLVEWDEGPLAGLSSAAQREQYAALAAQPGAPARREGDVAAAQARAAKRIEAVYEVPYLAHAPMEPLNCAVHLRAGRCDIWTGTQMQTTDQAAAAKIAGLPPEKVRIHTMLLGGGFGRRANPAADFVSEAVHVAKAAGTPVKVVWTREDDMRGGFYRPAAWHRVAGGIGEDGAPLFWSQHVVAQSIMMGTPFEGMVKDGVDTTQVEGVADLSYAVPNLAVDYHMAPAGVPVLWWRSVGHSFNAFVKESFVDELAHLAGQDPYAYRRALLAGKPRELAVLDLAAQKAGWGSPPAPGRFRGIAVHHSFGSWCAQVAEVSVSGDGAIRVHRVVCAIDCGLAVNPDGVKAQMESGIVFGLTAALYGAITFKDGRVEQSNFHDYPLLRMHEMPRVEVHVVPSGEPPSGTGEPGTPPIAPAVANAIFAATGKRLRRLPFDLGGA